MIIKRVLIFFGIFLVSLPILAENKTKIVATKINIYQPDSSSSYIRSQKGFCWTRSLAVARDDAWRCMVASRIFDPCFTIPSQDQNTLLCDIDPVENRIGFLLKLTEPLPEVTEIVPEGDYKGKLETKRESDTVWIVKLEDDRVCYPYTGTLPIVKRGRELIGVRYGCEATKDGKMVGLLTEFITSGKIWRAKKVTYLSDGSETKNLKIQMVKVKEVWK